MEKNDKMKPEIEATLNSIDKMSRAEAPPFFYARLTARMERKESSATQSILQLLTRPAVSISLLVLFLILNVVAIKGVMSPASRLQTNTADAQSFANEYNLNNASVYSN
jgi:hypothetical protein